MESILNKPLIKGSLEDSSNKDDTNPSNFMVTLIDGGKQGVKLAVGIATLLIIVLGLEELLGLL